MENNKDKKLFVIISDEETIERLLANKNEKIQVIDLDNDKNSNEEDNRLNRIAKKWIGAYCKICGDQAVGFNYNVLTCAACKTFFRRYINENLNELECLSNTEQCSISYNIRRKCLKCRMKKCLSMGMNKNFSKKKRKSDTINQLITTNDNRISPIDSKVIDDTLFSRLSVEDWIRIQTIQSSFMFYCDISEDDGESRIDLSNLSSAIVSWSYVGSDNAMRFINFFRHLNEFEQLNDDDRFILTKYNIFSIFLSSKGYYYKRKSGFCSMESWKQPKEEKKLTVVDLCDRSLYNLDRLDELKISLIQLTERDPIIISLLSIILIFSPGISMDENEPSLKDPLTIHRIQSYFTEMLWNYLIDKFDEFQAYQYFIQLFILILRIQLGTRDLRLFFQHQYIITNTADQIAPLMKTILHFS